MSKRVFESRYDIGDDVYIWPHGVKYAKRGYITAVTFNDRKVLYDVKCGKHRYARVLSESVGTELPTARGSTGPDVLEVARSEPSSETMDAVTVADHLTYHVSLSSPAASPPERPVPSLDQQVADCNCSTCRATRGTTTVPSTAASGFFDLGALGSTTRPQPF